jgi:2-haloacid dehalogenase
MRITIAFDVYGTLVNPLAIAGHLEPLVGDVAGRFAELWRTKQLEYSFRRGLMRAYRPFSLCSWESLRYTEKTFGVDLSQQSRAALMQRYKNLPPFPDAALGLTALKSAGHYLAAFSNGEADVVRSLLENTKLLPLLDEVVSADEVRTFKPDPALYEHAVRRLGSSADLFWLVSSNPFDVIGATSAGLRTAWVKRDPNAVLDPWGVEPDLVVSGLDQLAPLFEKDGVSRT